MESHFPTETLTAHLSQVIKVSVSMIPMWTWTVCARGIRELYDLGVILPNASAIDRK